MGEADLAAEQRWPEDAGYRIMKAGEVPAFRLGSASTLITCCVWMPAGDWSGCLALPQLLAFPAIGSIPERPGSPSSLGSTENRVMP